MYIPFITASKFLLILVTFAIQICSFFCIPSSSPQTGCEPVKNLLLSRGISNEIPENQINGKSFFTIYPIL